jgi:hypothetical protein
VEAAADFISTALNSVNTRLPKGQRTSLLPLMHKGFFFLSLATAEFEGMDDKERQSQQRKEIETPSRLPSQKKRIEEREKKKKKKK